MTRTSRPEMLAAIRSNIEQYGLHAYLVFGNQAPRFVYTIGVSQRAGTELLIAGAAVFSNDDAKAIIDALAAREASCLAAGSTVEVSPFGTFSLRKVDASWAAVLALGAIDYYDRADVPILQIVPDEEHWTIDVPDLSQPRNAKSEPVWQWLTDPWNYPVPDRSMAVTNLDALQGQPVTEAVRWEVDEWELFAGEGPAIPRDQMRRVPLGTLLAADPSLVAVTELENEKGLWRDPTDLVWHKWGK